MIGGFGDVWDCCSGGAGGPLIRGHVSVIIVPSSGFVTSPVPQSSSQCRDHAAGPVATILWWQGSAWPCAFCTASLGIHRRWGNTGREGLGPGQEGTSAPHAAVPMVTSFRLEGSTSPWFQGGWSGNVIFRSRKRQWIPKPFQRLESPAKFWGE